MRQIYSSPRQDNIDRVVALLAEHGIETTVTNRSVWKRSSYQRFSYSQQLDDRSGWPQVWINAADDFTPARALLRDIGIEPLTRYAEELAATRQPVDVRRPYQRTASRIRMLVLAAVAGAFVLYVLRAMQVL
jgi:broad specificity phosphatase PhoE